MRAAEVKRLSRDGYEPVLKRGRRPLLKHPENLNKKQGSRLRDLDRYLAGLGLDRGWLVIFDRRAAAARVAERTMVEAAVSPGGQVAVVRA